MAATCTRFCWEARLDTGQDQRPYLINAYEDGYGRLTIRLGGVLSVKKVTGPEVDKAGDSALPDLNHVLPFADIESSFARRENSGARDFATADREDATGVTVDLDFSSEACPLAFHATRPRLAGKPAVLTPWSAIAREFRDYGNLRTATHLEVAWHLPEGPFTYLRGEITSFTPLR